MCSLNPFKIVVTLIVMAVTMPLICQAAEYALEPAGYGGGGRYTAVAIAPDNEQRVYIGSDVAGIFVSEDGGFTYTPVGSGLQGLAVADIIVPPGRPDAVMVLCDNGLFYSVDRGKTMHPVSLKIRYEDRFFGSNLLLAGPDGNLYVGSDMDGVFKLTPPKAEDSLKWEIEPLMGMVGDKVNSLAFLDTTLFAATNDGIHKWNGESWKSCDKGFPFGKDTFMDLVALPNGPLITVERYAGAFKYDPAEDKWFSIGPNKSQIPGQGPVFFKALACHESPKPALFLATHPEYWPRILLTSSDMGETWQLITRFAQTSSTENWATGIDAVETVAFTKDGKRGFLLDWWNAWRSQDGGASWVQTVDGLQNTVVNDIAFPDGTSKSVFLAVADNGLMVTEDNGQSWQRRMKDVVEGHAVALAFSRDSEKKLYMIMKPWQKKTPEDLQVFHIYKSTDMGRTWAHYPIAEKRQKFRLGYVDGAATNLAVDPSNGDVIYVGTNGYGLLRLDTSTVPSGGGFISAENIMDKLSKPYIKGSGALIVHPDNPDIIYAGTLDGGVYRTTDRGKRWSLLPGSKGFIFGMHMDPNNPKRIIAAAGGNRVLLTTNGGDAWRSLTLPFEPGNDTATHAVAFGLDGKSIFVGTTGFNMKGAQGFYVSTDNGKSFQRVASDISPVGVLTLEPIPDAPNTAMAGYNGLGIFKVLPR